jgi:hypothetical protein
MARNEFDAAAAMKLHAKTQAALHGGSGLTKERVFGYAAWSAIAVVVLFGVFGGGGSGTSVPPVARVAPASENTGQRTYPSGPSEDLRTKTATLINIHGELCARVENISPLGGNRYSVTCTRYRDGTGSATYEIDASTGSVK